MHSKILERHTNAYYAKADRDENIVKEKLAAIKKAAEGTDNLMPHILEAVKVYATLGEITSELQAIFGEHKESVIL